MTTGDNISDDSGINKDDFLHKMSWYQLVDIQSFCFDDQSLPLGMWENKILYGEAFGITLVTRVGTCFDFREIRLSKNWKMS